MRFFLIILNLLVLDVANGQDLSQGLIHYYTFDNTLSDSSQNGLDLFGSNYSFDNDRNGVSNNCLSLSTNSQVYYPNDPIIHSQYPISYSLWVFLPNSSFGTYNPLFNNDFVENSYHGLICTIVANGRVSIAVGNGLPNNTSPNNRRSVTTNKSISPDEWHHIVYTLENGDFKIYVDGCEWETKESGTGTYNIVYNDDNGQIGISDNNTTPNVPNNYFKGLMDDFYMWNRIITEEEIALLDDNFIPALDMVDSNYSLDCTEGGISVEVSNEFYNVEWSDGQSGNSAYFSNIGEIYVSGMWDCTLVFDTLIIEAIENEVIEYNVRICEGVMKTLTANLGSEYLWNTGSTNRSIEITPQMDMEYSVEYIDQNGCVQKEVYIIEIEEIPLYPKELYFKICNNSEEGISKLNIIDSLDVDNGELFPLNGSPDLINGIFDGENSDIGEFSYDLIIAHSSCPNDTINIEIQVFDCLECDELPNTEFYFEYDKCNPSGIAYPMLNENSISGEWTSYPEGLFINSIYGSIDFDKSQEGFYTITNSITASNNCPQVSSSFNIQITKLDVEVSPDTSICLGDNVLLWAQGGDALWNNGQDNNTISVSPDSTTTYTVAISKEECVEHRSIAVSVDNPIMTIPSLYYELCNNKESELVDLSIYFDGYESKIVGDVSKFIEEGMLSGFNAEIESTSGYLLRMSDNSCPDDSTEISVNFLKCIDCMYGIPNIFSPNGDKNNDQFIISTNDEECLIGLSIAIFDRWGNKVYDDTIINLNSDNDSFTDLEKGVYAYMFYGNVQSKVVDITGSVTIIK